ncbi:hypothetical protein C4577_07535 [Candidatus Parcubacteria bacterium]|nr:MAG: hypothetical protein C4577_07535 [Candidatus Parcubacteria bacterium]
MFDYSRNAFLDFYLNGVPGITLISQVALLTEMPEQSDDLADLVEPVGNGYSRVTTGTNWTVPVNGYSYNSLPIFFPKATGNWGTIVGLAILAASGPIFYGPLKSPITITAATPALALPIGAIAVSVKGCLGQAIQNAILTSFLRQVTPSTPSTYYLGLSSVLPENDGTGWTEPTIGSNGYSRTQIDNTISWSAISAGQGYNILTINLPSSGAPSGTWSALPMVAWGLWSSSTTTDGTNDLYFFGRLRNPIVVKTGSPVLSFSPGEIEIGVDLACC